MNIAGKSVKVCRKSNIFPFAWVKIETKNVVSFSWLYSLRFKMSGVLAKKKLFQNECHFQFPMQ